MRLVIALAMIFTLAGCWWTGPVFYPVDPSRAGPLTPGVYDVVQDDGAKRRVRLLRLPDGSYVPEPRAPTDPPVSFVPFPLAGRDLWISQIISIDPARPGAVYGLLERRGAQADLLPLLMCEETADIVRASGGTIIAGEQSSTCRFETAASLERALSAFAAAHPRLPKVATVTRVTE